MKKWKCRKCNSTRKSGYKEICQKCYFIEYRRKNPEKNRGFVRKYQKSHLDLMNEKQKRYARKYPEKIRAHNLANYYLKHLKKKGFVFHHTDYSQPLLVEVITKESHQKIHRGI